MKVNLNTAASPIEAAHQCAAALENVIAQAIAARGRAMVAVSGGSTPRLMFDAMAKTPIDWANVHLFFVDERAVPPDHELSNYGMTLRHLIEPAGIPSGNVHRMKGELPPSEAARQYAVEISEAFGICDGEMPVFDGVQNGIGTDSHTASLFPGERLIDDRAGVAAAVHVAKMDQWRITLLPGVLLRARRRLVLATGADKSSALRQVLKSPWDPMNHPAQLLVSAGLITDFFIDTPAAVELG